ncbi:MAG: hypothetical protein R3290_03525 [Acidimicrobiia bacterium]|nr:hypothetical protein [Acidimicrobiia bacterium]
MTDRGSTTPMLAVLLFGGALLVGVTIDLGGLSSVWLEARRAARAGAEAGAAVVRSDALDRSELVVEVEAAAEVARRAALRSRPRPGRLVSVEARADRVCVEVRQTFRPGAARVVGATPVTASATACASPASG